MQAVADIVAGSRRLTQYGEFHIEGHFTELWLKKEKFEVREDDKFFKLRQEEILKMPNERRGG